MCALEKTYGLKLRKETKYSIKESGLTKLIFDKKSVTLIQRGNPWIFPNLKISVDKYTLESQVSETEYERLVCPVYVVKGVSTDNSQILLKGVIRPAIDRKSIYPTIFPEIPPEFQFYLEDSESAQIGKSIEYKNEKLTCSIMDWKRIEENKISSGFNITLDPRKSKPVYFQSN